MTRAGGRAGLRAALLAWYDRERRSMPWRERPSPYGTVVSEFMLQQTQVATVIPYFDRFLKLFPTFEALAAAEEDAVLAAWSGLGYYRRARMLRSAAQAVVRLHGGALPRDGEALRALPGFGDYTAAAVGSIVLGLPMAAVDGNVRRVISRWLALDAGMERTIPGRAAELLDRDRPGDWNQAVMELGALVCVPRAPRCMICPARRFCAAFRGGRPEAYPAPKARPRTVQVEATAVAAIRAGRVLLLRRGDAGSFAGMWELPCLSTREDPGGDITPGRVLRETAGLSAKGFTPRGESEAVFTHHRIVTRLHQADGLGRAAPKAKNHVETGWFEIEDLAALPASRAQKNLFEILRGAVAGNNHAGAGARKSRRSARKGSGGA